MALTLQHNFPEDCVVSAPAHSRLPRLDLGIDWGSPWEEFRTSVRSALADPRPQGDEAVSGGPHLRVQWIRGNIPGRAFLAAALCHVAFIWLITLPIWSFLPQTEHTLAPLQIELTWYPPQDLHPISLPAHVAPAHHTASPAKATPAPEATRGADAYHPRQTILSVPVRITHPRQTLIQPRSTPDAPKIVEKMPNIVQWAPEQPKLRAPLVASNSAPNARQVEKRDVAAPVFTQQKIAGPLDIAQANVPRVAIPLTPMSAPAARKRAATSEAAPEIGAASEGNANDLRRIVALSATPAPPAPEVRIPQGNLAANISISPDGANPGSPAGAVHDSTTPKAAANAAGTTPGAERSTNGTESASASLPAAISISPSRSGAASSGLGRPGAVAPNLNLKPMIPSDAQPAARSGPANVAALSPSDPPEKILSGEIFTLHLNSPNMTSTRGSWILSFAQLGVDPRPMYRPKGLLSGPQAVRTVDPKYPPETMDEHIDGEVVLYAIIRKSGSVDSIQLVRGLDPRLDKAAIDAIAQWQFRPGARDGVPVDLETVIHVPFEYRKPY